MATQKQKAAVKQTGGQKAKISAKEDRSAIVREEIMKAQTNIEETYVDLSMLMSEAYHQEMYAGWGFKTFEEYCTAELDIGYRKSMYLIDVWDKVKSLNLPKSKVSKLGWTKMKDLAGVLTAENAKEWLEKAEKMTTREVTEAVQKIRAKQKGKEPRPVTTKMTITMSEAEGAIILEAIGEAKKITENENTTVALEMICQDWMTDRGAIPEKTPLSTHIQYLEKNYGVKITCTEPSDKKRESLKEAAKKQQKTTKVVEEAEKLGTERKKAAKETAEKKPAEKKSAKEKEAPASGGDVDIEALLGVNK